LTRLSNLVNNLISVGSGREAAFSAAVLGDNALMEKAWQETGMLAEAVLHAHAHGRPSLRNLAQAWNKMLQKEREHGPSTKTDAASAFLASLEEPKLTSLADAAKKPPIEILPPGMASLYGPIPGQKKPPGPATPALLQQPGKPMLLEAAPSAAPPATDPPQPESGAPSSSESGAPPPPSDSSVALPSETDASVPSESGAPVGAPASSEPNAPVSSDSSAPGPTELSAQIADNQTPTDSLVADVDSNGLVENVVPSSASSQAITQDPHPVPNTQGPTTPDTALMIDFS